MKPRIEAGKRLEAASARMKQNDFNGALALIDEVLQQDGSNTDALGLRAQIIQAKLKQDAQSAVEVVRRASGEHDVEERVRLLERVAGMAAGHEVLESQLAIARNRRDVLEALTARARFFYERSDPAEARRHIQAARELFGDQPPVSRVERMLLQSETVPAPESVRQAPARASTLEVPSPPRLSRRSAQIAVAAAVLLCIAAVVLFQWRGQGTKPAPLPKQDVVAFRVRVNPAGAEVDIDGERVDDVSKLQLRPGQHQLGVRQTGYQPYSKNFNVPGEPLDVHLVRVAAQVLVESSIASELQLDGAAALNLEDGTASLQSIGNGHHALRLSDKKHNSWNAEFDWKGDSENPVVTRLDAARDTLALAVSGSRTEVVVWSSKPNLSIYDAAGKVIGSASPAHGLSISIPAGATSMDFVGREGELTWKVTLPTGNTPILYLGARPWISPGILLITVDQQDVVTLLDGKQTRNFTLRAGEARPLRASPGKHTVTLEKESFLPRVYEWTAVSSKSEQLNVTLTPTSAVQVRGAMPGMSITVNGRDLGATNAEGNLTSSPIAAGTCRVELQMPRHESRTIVRPCPHGSVLVLSGADVRLNRTSTVRFSTEPETAKATAVSDAGKEYVLKQGVTELPLGHYRVRITAPGYQTAEGQQFDVIENQENQLGAVKLKPR